VVDNRHCRQFFGIVLLLLLCAITGFIFGSQATELLHHTAALYFALACLPIVLTMMLSVACGNRGGSVALLTLGIIVIYYTDQHKGPFFLQGLQFTESLVLALSYLSATALLVIFTRVLCCTVNNFNPDTGASW